MSIAEQLLNQRINWDHLRDQSEGNSLNSKVLYLINKVVGACDGIIAMNPSIDQLKNIQLNLSSLFVKIKGKRNLDCLYWPMIVDKEVKKKLIHQVIERVALCRVKPLQKECEQLKSIQDALQSENRSYSSELTDHYFSLQRELDEQEETLRWLPTSQKPHMHQQILEARELLRSLRHSVIEGMRNDPKFEGKLLFVIGENIWLHDVIALCRESYTIQRMILSTPLKNDSMPLIVVEIEGPSPFTEVSAFLEGRRREEFRLNREEVESFLHWINYLQLNEEKTKAFYSLLENRLIKCYEKDCKAKKEKPEEPFIGIARQYGLKNLARRIIKNLNDQNINCEHFSIDCLHTRSDTNPLSKEERQKMISRLAQLRTTKKTEVFIGEERWAVHLKLFPELRHFLKDEVVVLPNHITKDQFLMLVEYTLFNTIDFITPKRVFELLNLMVIFPEEIHKNMISWLNQLIRKPGLLTGGKSSYVISSINLADNKLSHIDLSSGELQDSDIEKLGPLLPHVHSFDIQFGQLSASSWEQVGDKAKNLQSLSIQGISFTTEACQALKKVISGLKNLEVASIYNVSYENPSGFATIVEGFMNLTQLRVLNLPANRINRENKKEFLTLKTVLPSLTSLKALSLTSNMVGFDVVTEIVQSLLGLQNLTVLYLKLCDANTFWGQVDDYDKKTAGPKLMGALSNLPNLEELNLSSNRFEKKTTEALIETVNKMPSLKKLILDEYDFGETDGAKEKLFSLLAERGIVVKKGSN